MMIYLVDDDSAEREHSLKVFQSLGLFPICFSNTDTALRAIAYNLPDAVFTDLRMPNFSGLDLVQYVKTNHYSCKVFALTQYKLANIDIIKNTFDQYLTKPLRASQLRQALESMQEENDDD